MKYIFRADSQAKTSACVQLGEKTLKKKTSCVCVCKCVFRKGKHVVFVYVYMYVRVFSISIEVASEATFTEGTFLYNQLACVNQFDNAGITPIIRFFFFHNMYCQKNITSNNVRFVPSQHYITLNNIVHFDSSLVHCLENAEILDMERA